MKERGRHRAPGRHARPKNYFAPIVTLAFSSALIFGIVFNDQAYSIELNSTEPTITTSVVIDSVALDLDDSSYVDVKELSPESVLVMAEVEIPFEVAETADESIIQGTKFVAKPGTPGSAVIIYDVRKLNGVEVSRTEVSRSVNREPIPEVVVAGSGDPEAISESLNKAAAQINSVAASKKYAELYILNTYGWGVDQFACLEILWERESNWRYTAKNPSSSAYGIPQALPGSRMSEIAADWQTNPATQIQWGAKYIDGRYKTPCAALDSSFARGWY
jgi:hypothetical protein